MQSGVVLQHASACFYHIVKSHPVPCGHDVTFKNATVNDSTVHDGLPKGGEKFHISEAHNKDH